RLPFDYRGSGWGLAWMAVVFVGAYAVGAACVGGLPTPWGWLAATASESAAVLLALLGMWWLPVFDEEERAAIRRWCSRVRGRAGGAEDTGHNRSDGQ
ncbi:MAG: hypothetical protein MUF48_07555, partial [Pirellulaceae bacterium]|nr:hypothetical protein [Pirellulaceae bacterium]